MFELSQSFYFEAAHTLRRDLETAAEAAGSRRIHGHTYQAEVFGRQLRSEEAREAFTAFFEKRRPDFSRF